MKKLFIYTLLILAGMSAFVSCSKEEKVSLEKENLDYFAITNKPKEKWNALDSLCDTLYRDYGVKIVYEYTPQMIRPNDFYYPPAYDKALAYTRKVMKTLWLEPLKKNFPDYFKKETPIEFILMGGFYHGHPTNTAIAAGAGFNGQFYRLGMGGINNLDLSNKAAVHEHVVILWHEHAHNQDVKYGRGEIFDRVSVGTYYKEAWSTKNDVQAVTDGFFEAYGGFAPEEDFATTVEYLTRSPKSDAITLINSNEKLKRKYNLVTKFYLDKGMDLHKLQSIVYDLVYKK